MTSKRLRIILLAALGFICLIMLIVSLFGGTLLGQKSKAMVELKLQSKIADAQLASLAQSKKEVQQYGYFSEVAKTVLPTDKDQAQAVIDIFQLAASSGIAIASISFPTSTLGSKNSAPSSKDKDKPASASSTAGSISQAQPVEGIPGLYSILLTITPDISPAVAEAQRATYAKLLDFLSRIERNRRTAQISQVNIQPVSDQGGPGQFINFTLTINIFIKP